MTAISLKIHVLLIPFPCFILPYMRYQGAKVLMSADLRTQSYVPPQSWKKAVGLLRSKKMTIERYIQKSRKEWDRRVSL